MRRTSAKRGVFLLISVALILSFTLSSCVIIKEGADTAGTVEVLRLTKDISVGEKITPNKFEKVRVAEELVWIGALSDADAVVGKYSRIELGVGDYLIEGYLSVEKVEENKEKVDVDGNDRGFSALGYVVMTDHVKANTGADLSREIQKVINQNPKSVIYFPDGEYIISSPIATPANGDVSVALKLSDNAVIKASDDWSDSEAMIRLGGMNERNDINVRGSNYYLEGGIIDGNGKAKGISIDHGRETSVRDVTIVNTSTGLLVKNGANSGSSDADIENIRIYGNGALSSVGLQIQGWDNTFSNMQISNVQIGVKIETAANLLRDIHVTYVQSGKLETAYRSSIGFLDTGDRNWYDNCTSEGFSVGFEIRSSRSILSSCVAKWYPDQTSKQICIYTPRAWGSIARSCAAYFTAPKENCEYLVADQGGGKGQIIDPVFDETRVNREDYKSHLCGKVVFN
ncbi:MAG: hypothetical protein IKA68_00975 [Clostridia bacterium]|nr:hypothetical protein [Clostridia bacterium]MBR2613317.1 hypothetical protein [Clostridia bacterium]